MADKKQATQNLGFRKRRKKVDPFAGDKINQIDYKDVSLLKKFISERVYIRERKDTSSQSDRNICKGTKKTYKRYKKSKNNSVVALHSRIR